MDQRVQLTALGQLSEVEMLFVQVEDVLRIDPLIEQVPDELSQYGALAGPPLANKDLDQLVSRKCSNLIKVCLACNPCPNALTVPLVMARQRFKDFTHGLALYPAVKKPLIHMNPTTNTDEVSSTYETIAS